MKVRAEMASFKNQFDAFQPPGQIIATSAEVTPNGVLVRESDPQNGRNIQVKDL